ncbi:MAG: ROK family transcriptional regulator [Anaerolineae bacterium]|nr:ROK family transcriptional regulator [Anaerolineae bacterium]
MVDGPAGHNLVKQLNSAAVLERLLIDTRLSRAQLAQHTGLNRSTISSLVGDLMARQLIREVGLEAADSRGRPGMLLELNPGGGCIVGVEINVGYVVVLLTNFTAQTLWQRHVTFDEGTPQEEILALVEGLIDEALTAGQAHRLMPLGIGLGIVGLVDTATGTLISAPNLKWHNVSFRERWGQRFGVPLYVDNDGNVSALGEYYFGVAKGYDHFLFVGTGSGMSGGLMLDGRVYRGVGGYAGEIGHLIVESGGELCSCGRRGCWETLVAPRAIIRGIIHALNTGAPSMIPELVGGNYDLITMELVVDAANQGDQLALDTLADAAAHLGSGIANLVNIFNPGLIVLGGAMLLAGAYLLPPISRIVTAEALPDMSRMVALTLSALGVNACPKGAVAMVIDGIVRDPIS